MTESAANQGTRRLTSEEGRAVPCHLLSWGCPIPNASICSPAHRKAGTVLRRTTTAVPCGISSPPATPRVCLKTSSISSLERMSKISCLIQRKIICALSKSKHVGKLFVRRMYLAAIARGFDGCICALDCFMAPQWKLLIMNDNIYISIIPFPEI